MCCLSSHDQHSVAMSNVFPLSPYITAGEKAAWRKTMRGQSNTSQRGDRSGITMGVSDRSVAEKPKVKACQEDKNDSSSHPQAVWAARDEQMCAVELTVNPDTSCWETELLAHLWSMLSFQHLPTFPYHLQHLPTLPSLHIYPPWMNRWFSYVSAYLYTSTMNPALQEVQPLL